MVPGLAEHLGIRDPVEEFRSQGLDWSAALVDGADDGQLHPLHELLATPVVPIDAIGRESEILRQIN
jgi:hypothetical protein